MGTLFPCLSHHIHLFLPQLHSVSPPHPNTHISSGSPFALDLHMFNNLLPENTSPPLAQDSPLSSSSQAKTPTLQLFPLRKATQYLLLPLLKLTIYLLPSPPNHLIYITKVGPFCFQFHLFSHASSFHLIFTSDSSSLTPMAKTKLQC